MTDANYGTKKRPVALDPSQRIVNVSWGGRFVMAQISFSGGTGSSTPDAVTPWAITAQFIAPTEDLPEVNGDNAFFPNLLTAHPEFAERRTTWPKKDKEHKYTDPYIVYDLPKIDRANPIYSDLIAFAFKRIMRVTPDFYSAYSETIFFTLGSVFGLIDDKKLEKIDLKLRFYRDEGSFENQPQYFRVLTGRLPPKAAPLPITLDIVNNFLLRNIPLLKIVDLKDATIHDDEPETLPAIDICTISVSRAGKLGEMVFTTESDL